MTSDTLTSPSSPSVSTSTGRRIRVRPIKRSSLSQGAGLPSHPTEDNDNDWVSPFTLPPLPISRKQRSRLDRSPEDQLHNRSGSSAYYAAVWGSPYATPSPNQSPALRVNRNRSFDLEVSPLASRKSDPNLPSSKHFRQQSLPTQDSTKPTDLPTSPTPIETQGNSQRRNWLSESEDSGSEFGPTTQTPTQRQHRKRRSVPLSARSHHIQESVDTITPETFNGTSSIELNLEAQNNLLTMATSQTNSPVSAEEKPLPSLPDAVAAKSDEDQVQPRPNLPPPVQSFQRLKKKVPWKGKSCLIAMPPTDRDEAGLPPILTAQEKQERLQKWIDAGYPVHGFTLDSWSLSVSETGSASRSTFPDPIDMEHERRNNPASVQIPDQDEWLAWVDYLKEEKLRALGVTPSTTEAPPSTMSPFSSTMSRVSSTYPGIVPSPPVPTMSATRMNFPGLPQRSTPGFDGGRPMHGYNQSMAVPGMGNRSASPFALPTTQQGMYGANLRSLDGQFAPRQPWTPGHVQNMQSMANLRSPVHPSLQDFRRGFSPSFQIHPAQRQQQDAQARMASHQRQMSMFPYRAMSTEQVSQLPLTPKPASPEREPPEIMQPTPRSHRHNLSAALEKGVTESVTVAAADLSKVMNAKPENIDEEERVDEEQEEGEVEGEAAQEELPILHRPETLKDSEEKDEIETNPSIAGTPMLLDDQNPFANLHQFPLPRQSPATTTTTSAYRHSAQPSLSKLNVQAKEFSPVKPTFPTPANPFDFDGNAFDSRSSSPRKSGLPGPKSGHKHNPSSLGLNVDAPAFEPSFAPVATKLNGHEQNLPLASTRSVDAASHEPPAIVSAPSAGQRIDSVPSTFSFTAGNKSEHNTPAKSTFDPRSSQTSTFSFGSTAFNVEAPEFKPSGDYTPEKLSQHSSVLFGDVMVDPSSKSERRNKALVTEKPRSREGSAAVEVEERFGEDGRAEAPTERAKRARTFGKSDEEVTFADSAPFASLANEGDLEQPKVLADDVVQPDETAEADSETDSVLQDVSEPVEAASDSEAVAKASKLTASSDTEVQPEKSSGNPAQDVSEDDQKAGAAIRETSAGDPEHQTTEDDSAPVKGPGHDESQTTGEPSTAMGNVTVAKESQESVLRVIDASLPIHGNEAEEEASAAVYESSPLGKAMSPTITEQCEQNSEPAIDVVSDHEIDHGRTSAAKAVDSELKSASDAPVLQTAQPGLRESKFNLSATALPFEVNPAAQEFVPKLQAVVVPTASTATIPKKAGLMASRFASSPPRSAPKGEEGRGEEEVRMVNRNSSPPQEIFGQSGIEVSGDDQAVVTGVAEHTSTMSETNDGHIDTRNGSQDVIDTLEEYKEENSRSNSMVSREGDMSLDEINAVMKQFEDNPDLGVIREDSPVEPTPLIDMRHPQQLRSDAPSPSPNRKLDGPFNLSPVRPPRGLGFEISGVHQLNYGGDGDVSDWNAALSPGQQEKLEARAHFFDDHVYDLVDNTLESRLAPLERALQSIQTSVQQVSNRTRHSRRSASTNNKDSDADDEDDYDAYEGYSHYRSQSPRKHDRRQERLKAAVLEAMTAAHSLTAAPLPSAVSIEGMLSEVKELVQRTTIQPQPPSLDLGSIQEILLELRTLAQQQPQVHELGLDELAHAVTEIKVLTQQRATEPQLDLQSMQATLTEIKQMASQQYVLPAVDISAIQQSLAELKVLSENKHKEQPNELRILLEDVIASHPRLRGSRAEQDHDSSQKLQTKVNDLEAMLRVAEKQANGEVCLRREAEEANEALQRQLNEARDQAALQKEALDQMQKSLEIAVQEKQEYRGMDAELRNIRLNNEALKETLDEYRISTEQLRETLNTERGRNDDLACALQNARQQHKNQMESRDVLRDQATRLQERMNAVMQDIHHDEAEWRKREHDLLTKNQLLQASLDHETNRRARMELEAERMNKEHRESLQYRSRHETAQEEVTRLAAIIIGLQTENKKHQDAAHHSLRELEFRKEKDDEVVASRTATLQAELDAARNALQNLQSDQDARIARLQGQLDNAAIELLQDKARHESNLGQMFENHNRTVAKANKDHADELDHKLALHEEKLVQLRNQHSRDMNNAAEDRKILEDRYIGKLELSNDKIEHLEAKVRNLEERLEIANQAARAAVAAATKGVNLPTPAPGVIASPPHGASLSLAKGMDLPEKISPQALRETILVLQDQLQNREQKIDKLEAQLLAIDKDAPAKVKERDTEIVMLRELLDVRIDDLQELVATLEKPDYSQAAVKDAAIRLKTQIKMEQQLKERAITGANMAANLPASLTSGLVNLTQSPRAMVAAAAWGNWRKVRDSGVGSAVSDFASNIGSQTPSRSSSTPATLLTSMMTPPTTNKSPGTNSRPSAARPLAAAASARNVTGPGPPSAGARPLRAFSSQPRTLSSARPLGRRDTNESTSGSLGSVAREPSSTKVEPPSTPLQLATGSDFGDDVDEDASPLDGKERAFDADVIDELPKHEGRSSTVSSPKKLRLSSGKLDSPGTWKATAASDRGEYVEVVEEE
ncbi:hypothetical protein LTR64_006539 [Lithohypha guttulata]|uniref:uncharacterized protein n=1 Tax=Lithohypha guttulata TaxID=1690604 RepID=UPI002DE0237D|nr:hypothetical protein LTR51_004903 [Lithohypha guttulata]